MILLGRVSIAAFNQRRMPYREFERNQVTNLHDVDKATNVIDGEKDAFFLSGGEVPGIFEFGAFWESVCRLGFIRLPGCILQQFFSLRAQRLNCYVPFERM